MMFLRLVLLLSLAGLMPAFVLPGQGWADLAFLAAILALASGWLVWRRRRTAGRGGGRARSGSAIVIDGSNVMHWNGETPRIETVREVIAALADQGFKPGVVFDANAGHKLAGRYLDDKPLARMLGLPPDRVLVVPKGTPADPVILDAAHSLGARVVTNDRFRDWAETHPQVAAPGYLIRGGYRAGVLWLDPVAEPA